MLAVTPEHVAAEARALLAESTARGSSPAAPPAYAAEG
jgi:hypothetical protein